MYDNVNYNTPDNYISPAPTECCEKPRANICDKATKIHAMVTDAIMKANAIRSNLIGSADENTSVNPPINCLNVELDCIAGELCRLNEILFDINSAL